MKFIELFNLLWMNRIDCEWLWGSFWNLSDFLSQFFCDRCYFSCDTRMRIETPKKGWKIKPKFNKLKRKCKLFVFIIYKLFFITFLHPFLLVRVADVNAKQFLFQISWVKLHLACNIYTSKQSSFVSKEWKIK